MSFGAILKDFSRDDLIELYRLVIKKYESNRPEEMYDRVLWGDLKTMFDPPLNRKYPLSKDACQVMLKIKILDGTMDEVCYQLLKMIEKQAGIRKHQELASPKQKDLLATPEQTATGKEISNPLIADSLLKTISCDEEKTKTKRQIIMEYLVKICKKARILELKRRNMKKLTLTSYTPYPSRKIRHICACTSQNTTKEQIQYTGLEVGSIRRIQGIRYGVLEFLEVGTMFDIFQNIHILYLQYGVLTSSGYGVLIFFPLWSLVSACTDTLYLP
ncbi:hypothetical protein Tco_0452543 [Tanacetum coccineum]